MKEGSEKGVIKAQQDIVQRTAELKGLQSQFSSVSNKNASTPAEKTFKASALNSLASKIRSMEKRIVSANERLAENNARLKAMPDAEALVNKIHQNAKLRFRIIADVQGFPVTLYDAGYGPKQ
jgi:hypothetical protein